MTLSSKQAAEVLREVDAVSQRSGQLYRYRRAAPMLMLWGVIWFLGFSLTSVIPAHVSLIWMTLDVVGVLGCVYFARSGKGERPIATTLRWLASLFSIFAFYVLTLIVLQPTSGIQSAALISLIVALFYVLTGFWVGSRFAVAGTLLAALTLFGYFVLVAHFYVWMALVGGGALILAGVWLRRA
jgi:hypothetical protein